MKKIYLLLLIFTNILHSQVSDTFNYTGTLNTNGWTTHSGTSGQQTTTSNSLSYNNICTQGNKTKIVSGSSTTEDVNLVSTSPLTGSIYYSCIINVTSTTGLLTNISAGDYFMHLSSQSGTTVTTFQSKIYIKSGTVANTFNLGIFNTTTIGTPTWDITNYNINTTYFLVVKYNLSNNTAYLFINPTLNSEGTANITNNTGTAIAPTSIKSICIRQASNGSGNGTGNIEIDEVRLGSTWEYVTNQTTWSGTWSNGNPDQYKKVTINSNYNTTSSLPGNFDACSINVTSNGILNINNTQYVNIQNELTNNGTVNITDGSLVQINNSTNTGNINYNRNVTGLHGYDYVYWSSPVNNQILSNLYTTPTMGNSYEWNTTYNNTNGTQGNWITPTINMINGKGYIIRSSSSYGWTGNLTSLFTGVPNNGNITLPIQRGSLLGVNDNFNLVGNPYPSSIKITDFLSANTNIDGYVSLWQHTNAPISSTSPFYDNFQYNYSNDYITVNGTGATNSSITPYYISSGQGFFTSMLETSSDYGSSTGNLNFTNSMRSKNYDNNIFYKTVADKSRIWLDLVDSNNIPNRILIGYVDDATNQRDRIYDAITTISSTNKIYSIINSEPFVIQGRQTFDESDLVQLGININTTGEYKIAIAETDGIFTTQNIYLEDLYSNIIYDIRQSPYTFNSFSGTFNDRFVLRYTNNSLGNNDFIINNTVIYNKNNKINIDSNKIIKNVKIYDITGKILYDNNFNSNDVKISLECSKQILFVKIKTEDDQVITKKVFNE